MHPILLWHLNFSVQFLSTIMKSHQLDDQELGLLYNRWPDFTNGIFFTSVTMPETASPDYFFKSGTENN